jgi:hypothetical protein
MFVWLDSRCCIHLAFAFSVFLVNLVYVGGCAPGLRGRGGIIIGRECLAAHCAPTMTMPFQFITLVLAHYQHAIQSGSHSRERRAAKQLNIFRSKAALFRQRYILVLNTQITVGITLLQRLSVLRPPTSHGLPHIRMAPQPRAVCITRLASITTLPPTSLHDHSFASMPFVSYLIFKLFNSRYADLFASLTASKY